MKTKHLCILAIVVLAIATSPSPAQNPQAVQQLEARVQQLEAQNDLLEKKLEFKETALDTAYAQNLRAIEQKISDDAILIRITLTAITIFSVGSIVALFFGISKFAEKKAEEKISAYFTTMAEAFRAMVHDYQREVELQKGKRIHVLHAPNANTVLLEMVLQDRGFQYPMKNEIGAYQPDTVDDLIFFYDETGDLDEQIIYETAKRTPAKVFCFYYGKKVLKAVPDAVRNRFSFANAPTQIYSNLINALRHQSLLSRLHPE